MHAILQKLPFLVELFFNGAYILIHALREYDKLPPQVDPMLVSSIIEKLAHGVPLVVFFVLIMNYLSSESFEDFLRKHIFSVIVFFPMILTLGDEKFTFWLASSHLIASVLALYEGDEEDNPVDLLIDETDKKAVDKAHKRLRFSPAQLILFYFFMQIAVGAGLLMLPFSSANNISMGLIDALFMATSATCVTGLGTLSLSQDFSTFGQIIILIMMQIGGLGYMTLSTSMAIFLGRSMAMRDRLVMQDTLNLSSQEEVMGLIRDILRYTFWIELWGGLVLTAAFTFEDYEISQAAYYGFFHSISAFCNAGFSLFDNSLESFSTNPLIHGTIAILIIMGGIGFIVLKEVRTALTEGKSFVRFSLHSKVALITTLLLVAGAMLFIFFGEFLHGLDGYSLWDKIQVSFFQSVTLRTAGFNSIPLQNFNTYTIYVMSLFMFIGAGPGSTAGGIKITTFAILVQSVKSTLQGKSNVEFFDRRISNLIVVKATALIIISLVVNSFFIFLLMKLEPNQNFLSIFFEVISASGTVGLSLGLTPYLSPEGKLAISILMFIGRTGPLTLILAIGQRQGEVSQIEYPEGRMIIG